MSTQRNSSIKHCKSNWILSRNVSTILPIMSQIVSRTERGKTSHSRCDYRRNFRGGKWGTNCFCRCLFIINDMEKYFIEVGINGFKLLVLMKKKSIFDENHSSEIRALREKMDISFQRGLFKISLDRNFEYILVLPVYEFHTDERRYLIVNYVVSINCNHLDLIISMLIRWMMNSSEMKNTQEKPI